MTCGKKAYTVEELQIKIDDYFDSLRAYLPLVVDGVQAVDDQGRPITREIAINPPTVAGICNYLNISKKTWYEWRHNENSDLQPVAEAAQQRIEQYLEEKLITNRQVDGVKFNLTNNFKESWKEKQEIEIGEETRKAEALSAISLREKLALIISASEKARKMFDDCADDGQPEAPASDDEK